MKIHMTIALLLIQCSAFSQDHKGASIMDVKRKTDTIDTKEDGGLAFSLIGLRQSPTGNSGKLVIGQTFTVKCQIKNTSNRIIRIPAPEKYMLVTAMNNGSDYSSAFDLITHSKVRERQALGFPRGRTQVKAQVNGGRKQTYTPPTDILTLKPGDVVDCKSAPITVLSTKLNYLSIGIQNARDKYAKVKYETNDFWFGEIVIYKKFDISKERKWAQGSYLLAYSSYGELLKRVVSVSGTPNPFKSSKVDIFAAGKSYQYSTKSRRAFTVRSIAQRRDDIAVKWLWEAFSKTGKTSSEHNQCLQELVLLLYQGIGVTEYKKFIQVAGDAKEDITTRKHAMDALGFLSNNNRIEMDVYNNYHMTDLKETGISGDIDVSIKGLQKSIEPIIAEYAATLFPKK